MSTMSTQLSIFGDDSSGLPEGLFLPRFHVFGYVRRDALSRFEYGCASVMVACKPSIPLGF